MNTQTLAVREEISPEQFDQNIVAAQHKAQSLKRIVDSQGLSVHIGTSEHLKVEAWLTIAAGYGFSPRIAWSRPLQGGGYEAHAELVDSLGTVIGAGEAECGTEGDDHWKDKPVFQQRSMAQTRATVRACRNKLAWVVVLAGYSPAPAEEMVAESKDNRYWCAEHKTNWTQRSSKDGKSIWYSHKQVYGNTWSWCNMKDIRLDAKDKRDWTDADHVAEGKDTPAATPSPDEAERPPMAPASAVPARVGDLLSLATKSQAQGGLGYKDRAAVFEKLGIESATEIASKELLAAAWTKLQA